MTGTRTERETALEAELETERKARKDRELQICELLDERERAKQLAKLEQPVKPKKVRLTLFSLGD